MTQRKKATPPGLPLAGDNAIPPRKLEPGYYWATGPGGRQVVEITEQDGMTLVWTCKPRFAFLVSDFHDFEGPLVETEPCPKP